PEPVEEQCDSDEPEEGLALAATGREPQDVSDAELCLQVGVVVFASGECRDADDDEDDLEQSPGSDPRLSRGDGQVLVQSVGGVEDQEGPVGAHERLPEARVSSDEVDAALEPV